MFGEAESGKSINGFHFVLGDSDCARRVSATVGLSARAAHGWSTAETDVGVATENQVHEGGGVGLDQLEQLGLGLG